MAWSVVILGAAVLAGVLLWQPWRAHRAPPRPLPTTVAPVPRVPPAPPGFTVRAVPGPVTRVLDGDTFEADLDGDGTVQIPRERVRLLYVDTPELHASRKGKDLAHGLPAKEFLAQRLAGRKAVLWVPVDRPTGLYGRTLAVVWADGKNVNLALVRAGHSYFSTRFTFPPGRAAYAAYAAAEAEAFTARRGIWRDADSRGDYLKRLAHELKTPAAADNPRFLPGVQQAAQWQPADAVGRYAVLEGTVDSVHTLRKQVRRVDLRGPRGRPFPVVAWRRYAERLNVDRWHPGSRVHVEGFVHTYRGHPELVLHYGFPLP